MGLKDVVRGGFGIARGVIAIPFFKGEVYCQSCRCDASLGRIVVSKRGRAYCDNDACLLNATIYGDEVENPRTTGSIYNPRLIGFAVGSKRLVHYKQPPDIARSAR